LDEGPVIVLADPDVEAVTRPVDPDAGRTAGVITVAGL